MNDCIEFLIEQLVWAFVLESFSWRRSNIQYPRIKYPRLPNWEFFFLWGCSLHCQNKLKEYPTASFVIFSSLLFFDFSLLVAGKNYKKSKILKSCDSHPGPTE